MNKITLKTRILEFLANSVLPAFEGVKEELGINYSDYKENDWKTVIDKDSPASVILGLMAAKSWHFWQARSSLASEGSSACAGGLSIAVSRSNRDMNASKARRLSRKQPNRERMSDIGVSAGAGCQCGLFGYIGWCFDLFAFCHGQLHELAGQQHRIVETDEGRRQKQGHILQVIALLVR